MRLVVVAILAALALAACERAESPGPEPAAPVADIREVAAADAYGEAGERVNAVAFWSHPTVNFQGLVISSTEVGLKAYDIESGALVAASLNTGETGGVSVIYEGAAPSTSYAIAAAGAGYVARAIDNKTRSFEPVDVEMAAPRTGAFCVGRRGDAFAVYEVGDAGIALREMTVGEAHISIGDPRPFATGNSIASCHVDDRDGAIITVGKDGAIRRIDPETGESFGLALIEGMMADGSALLLSTGVADGPKQGGAVVVLDGESGLFRVVDLADGQALGMARVKSTFDLEAVASAKAIAIGSGNYGGVYRDGILAVVADVEDAAPIRLVPWNGVLAALQLPLGENVDPRNPSPKAEDESVIDIELIEP